MGRKASDMGTNQPPDSDAEHRDGSTLSEAPAMEHLRTSETRYRRLFESAKDGILILEAETGMVTDVNPYLLDLLGYSYIEVLKKKVWELSFFADVVANKGRFEELKREKYVRYEDLALEGRDGRRHDVEFVSNVYLEGTHEVIQCNIREISERKRNEAKIRHLLQVLRAVRNVSQLIIHEKDRDALLQRSCEVLISTRGYRSAWVALRGEDGAAYTVAECGIGEDFAPLRQALERGDWPDCCRQAWASPDNITPIHSPDRNCKGCDLAHVYRDTAALAGALRHGGRDFGVLVVSLPVGLADDPEERSLLRDLVDDVAYALHTMEVGEESKRAEVRTKKLLSQQMAINRFALALGALLDLQGICRVLADEVGRLQGTDTLILSRFDKSTNVITPLYVMMEGTEMDVTELPPLPLAPEGEGMQSQVLRTGKPLCVPDWAAREATLHTQYAVTDQKVVTSQMPDKSDRTSWTQSAVFVPLMISGTPIGVMQVQSRRLDDFDADDVVVLEGMASVAAAGIERAQLHGQVRAAFEGVVHALAASTEMRDPYTAGHQRRVTELACDIAAELGLDSERREILRVAGLLHDIGKMSVPAEILSKPSGLSSLEMALVKGHARAGYEIVRGTALPKEVADAVLHHHERMDGSGYPDGLSGEAILLEARILAVADVVEAIASHRPYRAAHTLEEALTEIETGAGTLYDADVTGACVRLFREGRFRFSDEPEGQDAA